MNDVTAQPMLAIDTSGPTLRMAIGFGHDRLVKYEEKIVISHGRVMLKKVDDLLQSSGILRRDLHSLAVSVGPGSFTGLRIGLSMAKGLAVALDLVIVSMSAFELAAWRLRDRDRETTVLIPFKKDSCFAGTVVRGEWRQESVETIAYKDISTLMQSRSMVAYDEDVVRLAQPHGVNGALEVIAIGAEDFIHLGRLKLDRGLIADPALLEPLYVQRSQAEIRYEQRRRT